MPFIFAAARVDQEAQLASAPANGALFTDRKEFNLIYIGLLFGLYVLFTIGIYHVLVVKLERWFGTWPWIMFFVLGSACLLMSLKALNAVASMWWGYNAFLNLWSVKEMFDQHKRVGHY